MSYDRFIVKRNSNFVRLRISDMTVEDLFEIINSDLFTMVFSVFPDRNYEVRFKVKSFTNIDDLVKDIESRVLNRVESGINSDDFNIIEAVYLDCYYTLYNE
jgi:hypothetical protein